MTRHLISWILLLVAAVACVGTSDTTLFDPTTGRVREQHRTRYEVRPFSAQFPGGAVQIGNGRDVDTGHLFEVFDTDGDQKPDLVKNVGDGKLYQITGWTPVNSQRRSVNSHPGYQWDLNVYRNDPKVKENEKPSVDGGTLCQISGMNRETALGTHIVSNNPLMVRDVKPASDILSTQVRVAFQWCSDWKLAALVDHPQVRYEILGAMPTRVGDPAFLVVHLEGPLLQVLTYLIGAGFIEWTGVLEDGFNTVGFRNDPVRAVTDFFHNNNLIASLRL